MKVLPPSHNIPFTHLYISIYIFNHPNLFTSIPAQSLYLVNQYYFSFPFFTLQCHIQLAVSLFLCFCHPSPFLNAQLQVLLSTFLFSLTITLFLCQPLPLDTLHILPVSFPLPRNIKHIPGSLLLCFSCIFPVVSSLPPRVCLNYSCNPLQHTTI